MSTSPEEKALGTESWIMHKNMNKKTQKLGLIHVKCVTIHVWTKFSQNTTFHFGYGKQKLLTFNNLKSYENKNLI